MKQEATAIVGSEGAQGGGSYEKAVVIAMVEALYVTLGRKIKPLPSFSRERKMGVYDLTSP